MKKKIIKICEVCLRKRPYYCKGMCKTCYTKQLVPRNWARNFDNCISCGGTEFKHQAHGLCEKCFASQKDSGEFCACGCGLRTTIEKGKSKKFRKGHWVRTQKEGSKFQQEQSERMSGSGNPQYGKFGKQHPSFGHKTSEQTRELRRQVAIKRIVTQKKSKTDIENILCKILDEIGVKHISQYPFKNKFVVDEFLPDHNIIIEANGDYWHGNPSKFPNPNQMQKRNMRKDKGKFMYIHACGYVPVFMWGSELLHHKEICRKIIIDLTKHSVLPLIKDSIE